MMRWCLPRTCQRPCCSFAVRTASAIIQMSRSRKVISRPPFQPAGAFSISSQTRLRRSAPSAPQDGVADLIVRGGAIVTRDGVLHADIAVEDGTISRIGAELSGAREEVDA